MDSESFIIYEFGPFRLNVKERLLWREGRPVRLTAKAFDILSILVSNSGSLIKKDELMGKVWPDTSVEDNNLTVSISAVRKALGEKKGGEHYIKTISGLGYRFVAVVRKIADADLEQEVVWRAGTYVTGEREYQTIDSLAVLPFTVDSKEKELAYLSDGVAESLINNLSLIPKLRVMARNTVFHFGRYDVDAMEFGRKLGVRAVLIGRMIHIDCSLVVRVELVDSVDGSLIWGEQYTCELSGLLVLQKEISQEIAKNLRLMLASKESMFLVRKLTISSDAFRLYLKGRYFWNKYTCPQIERSIEYFQRAIELDPNYALAHAGLAEAYFRLSNTYLSPRQMMPQAKAAALRAVGLDEGLAEGHAAIGMVKLYYDHDWAGSENEYSRAIELNPSLSLAHQRRGSLLMFQRNFSEALEEFEKAHELDPLSLQLSVNMCFNLDSMGHHHEAVSQLLRAIELEPNYYPTRIMLGVVYLHQNKFEEAIAEFQEAFRMSSDYTAIGYIGYTLAKQGKRDEAKRLLKEMEGKLDQQYISPFQFAIIYAGLSDKDRAFEWLEIAYSERNDWMVWLNVSQELNELRDDARYRHLLRRVGFN